MNPKTTLLTLLPAVIITANAQETNYHKFLDVAQEAQFDIQPESYNFINSIIKEAKETIKVPEIITENEVQQLTGEVMRLIQSYGVENKSTNNMEKAINKLQFDCYETGLLYTSILQSLGANVTLNDASDHIYTTWTLSDNTNYNWDLMENGHFSNQEYANALQLTPEEIELGAYLRPMNDSMITSLIYEQAGQAIWTDAENIGARTKRATRMQEAHEMFEKALAYDRKNPEALYGAAMTSKDLNEKKTLLKETFQFAPESQDLKEELNYVNELLQNK